MITFRPAMIDDLSLLQYRDTQPHVLAAGVDDRDWEDSLGGQIDWRDQLIAELDGRAIGYLEIIDPAADPEQYRGSCGPGLRAIDIWIGELADTGKGYGSEMMRQAAEKCFADPTVTALLVDPLATNKKAHRFYERCGFQYVEERWFDEDHCYVYRIER